MSGNATIELIVQAPSYGIGGGLNNQAQVTAIESESNTGNNSATENTQLVSNAARLCYVVSDDTNELIEFDTSGIENVIGSTVATGIEAIAFNSTDGLLYAADSGRFGRLTPVPALSLILATLAPAPAVRATLISIT